MGTRTSVNVEVEAPALKNQVVNKVRISGKGGLRKTVVRCIRNRVVPVEHLNLILDSISTPEPVPEPQRISEGNRVSEVHVGIKNSI